MSVIKETLLPLLRYLLFTEIVTRDITLASSLTLFELY